MWWSRYTLGLEMSDYALKIAEVRIRAGSKPTVTRHATERLPAGAVEEGRIRDRDLVVQTLRNLVRRMEPYTRNVHLALPGSLVMVRFLKLPDLPERRLRKIIEFELKHGTPLPFKTPHFDFVKLGTPDGEDRRTAERRAPDGQTAEQKAAGRPLCDVMLAAAPLETVREYAEIIAAAGLAARSIEIRPLSLYRLVTRTGQADPEGTFLLADVGETVTDLSVFHGGGLRITRSLPIMFAPPGEGVLAGAADGEPAGVMPAAGPEASATDGLGGSNGPGGSDADTAFRSACSDLAHELDRLMLFFSYSLYRDRQIDRIILSGDAPRLEEVARFLSARLSAGVSLIQGEALKLRAVFGEKTFPAMAVPIGLALRGKRR